MQCNSGGSSLECQVVTSPSTAPATQNGTKDEGKIAPCAAVALRKAAIAITKSVPNTAPATQNDIPHTTDLHQTTLSRCAPPATEFPRGHHLTQPWQCDPQKARNTIRPKCCAYQANCTWTSPKCCACHKSWKHCKSIAADTENELWQFLRHFRMSSSTAPATQNDITTSFETFKSGRFCSFPHRRGDATTKPENREGTCWKF